MKEDDIHVFLKIVKKSIKQWPLPFVERLAEQGSDPFKILIACILSLRTRDQTTAEASERLFSIASNPYSLAQIDLKVIEKAIFPVGFFRMKAEHIRTMSQIISKERNGKVPNKLEDLVSLPGVGRKTANLVLTMGYNLPGICVDSHVHRICNRWGYVVTRNPDETEQALRNKLPKKYWISLNGLLVPFGQSQCTPISPYCSSCELRPYCEKVGVVASR